MQKVREPAAESPAPFEERSREPNLKMERAGSRSEAGK